jgi:hypothetical protein
MSKKDQYVQVIPNFGLNSLLYRHCLTYDYTPTKLILYHSYTHNLTEKERVAGNTPTPKLKLKSLLESFVGERRTRITRPIKKDKLDPKK